MHSELDYTESNGSTPTPDFILSDYIYRRMQVEGVERASKQFENLSGRLGPALDTKPCLLARWTHSMRIQQNGAWKGILGVIMEKLVSVPQTRFWRL